VLIFISGISVAGAVEGQLQFSPYFDSNVRESLSDPASTYGLVARGRLNHELRYQRWNLRGEGFVQSNLDAIYQDETKLIANADLDLGFALSPVLNLLGQLGHFRKAFYGQDGSYLWTEYSTHLEFSPSQQFSGWLGFRERRKTLNVTDRFRFVEHGLELRGRYQVSSRLYIESVASRPHIVHRDFNAIGIHDDTLLVILPSPQKDSGSEGLVHLRYVGRLVFGVQIGIGDFQSNSVMGEFSFNSYQAYFTGQLGSAAYIHLMFRRVDKHYRYPKLIGWSQYRDPEEPNQDITHLRLERVLNDKNIIYLQVSLLRNETILNHRYYDKTLFELGLKVSL
jgi:hypothetical protein